MSDDLQVLQALTTRVVAAYLTHNAMSPTDLPALISTTAAALAGLGRTSEPAALTEPLKPAVPIRRSVNPDSITCLICGQRGRMLKRHLASEHNMTPDDYRRMFGLPREYPMVAPQYAAQRSELAKTLGLGRNRRKAEPVAEAPSAPSRKRAARKG